MNIYGICVVKNEADIIELSLTKASEWATKIFVLDNCSTDGTWEKINNLARANTKIVPWKQTDEVFSDGIRADVYNHFKDYATDGDWWCNRLDADEFYPEDPRVFIAKIKPYYQVICAKRIQYRLTEEDLATVDFKTYPESITSKLRYFEKTAHSEIRFFKHRRRLKWDRTEVLPYHIGLIAPDRIVQKHYQYRSPSQIQDRIHLRMELKKKYPDFFPHLVSANWKDYIIKSTDCEYDTLDLSKYTNLPVANDGYVNYSFPSFWIRRIFHSVGILP